jgi:hypothetical protein
MPSSPNRRTLVTAAGSTSPLSKPPRPRWRCAAPRHRRPTPPASQTVSSRGLNSSSIIETRLPSSSDVSPPALFTASGAGSRTARLWCHALGVPHGGGRVHARMQHAGDRECPRRREGPFVDAAGLDEPRILPGGGGGAEARVGVDDQRRLLLGRDEDGRLGLLPPGDVDGEGGGGGGGGGGGTEGGGRVPSAPTTTTDPAIPLWSVHT